jgi:hypothetical protein
MKMPRMAAPPPLTVHAITRSGLVLTGLLLLAVGFGNMVAGRMKIAQYKDVLSVTSPPAPADPASLFPSPSEGDERSHLVHAKLAFYQLLLTAGQLLSASGAALVGFGALRVWLRAARLPADVTAAN